MKKVCVITAARSEYGVLRWLIEGIAKDKALQLQLVVTGGHLSPEQGLTYKAIEEDGYYIDEKVEMFLSSDSSVGIVKSMGLCSIGISDAYRRLKPDLIVILGDRYELLSIAGAALVMGIPIAHISGGDITKGAIDNEVRNAITMISNIHFPGTEESEKRIVQMKGDKNNVFKVGEPGLDNFIRLNLLDKKTVAQTLNLDMSKKWVLVTYHSETYISIDENLRVVNTLKEIMCETTGIQFVITKANTDLGGYQINNCWNELSLIDPKRFSLFDSLGQIRYMSLMRFCSAIMGNSSSGIIEAPFLGIPVLNIGNRQEGRHMCSNIISCSSQSIVIKSAFEAVLNKSVEVDKYWGDGHSSDKILSHIKDYLLE